MRTITATFLATTLTFSSAFAGNGPTTPLPAGKPAGTKQAAVLGPNFALILLGMGVVIGGITLAVSSNGNDGVTSPVTSTTVGLP
jgi:hypothetical protein